MDAQQTHSRIAMLLPRAKALAVRGGVHHHAWNAVADAEAYLRGAPTFYPVERIAAALADCVAIDGHAEP